MSKRFSNGMRFVALFAMPVVVAGGVFWASSAVKMARENDSKLASTVSETYVLGDTLTKPQVTVTDPSYDARKGEFEVFVTIFNPSSSTITIDPSQFSIKDDTQTMSPIAVTGVKTMTKTDIDANAPMTARLVFKASSKPTELYFAGANDVYETISL